MTPANKLNLSALLAALALGAGCEGDLLGQLPETTYCPPGQSCVDMAALGGGGGPQNCDPNATSGDNKCKTDGGGGNTGGGDDGGTGNTGGDAGGAADMRPAGPVDKVVRFGSAPGTTPFDYRSDGSARIRLDKDDNIVLDTQGLTLAPKPVIWIANSGAGTESKIDTRTYKQLARYCTGPGCNQDPSRSTVGLSGNVVVTNRANYFYDGALRPERASAVMIAGDKKNCVDRNGNGVIDTFEGEGDIPAQFVWQANQAQSPDECVIWHTYLTKDHDGNVVGGAGTLPRAAAYDAIIDEVTGGLKEYVYVGLYGSQNTVRIDAKTGQILKSFKHSGTQPYGAVMDKDGFLYIRNAANNPGMVRIAVRTDDSIKSDIPGSPCPYGITADSRGYIYTAGSGCIARYNPATNGWQSAGLGGPDGRGLAIDANLQAWVAGTDTGLVQVDVSSAFGGAMPVVKTIGLTGAQGGVYFTGAGLDVDGVPWAVCTGSGNLTTSVTGQSGAISYVYRVDPTNYAVTRVNTGKLSYTYSDMTGAQLRLAGSPTGAYRQIVQSECGAKTKWDSFAWTIDTPAGTTVKLRIRGGADLAALNAAAFTDVGTLGNAGAPTSPATLSFPQGTAYLQVDAGMKSGSVTTTPVIKDLTFKYTCLP